MLKKDAKNRVGRRDADEKRHVRQTLQCLKPLKAESEGSRKPTNPQPAAG